MQEADQSKTKKKEDDALEETEVVELLEAGNNIPVSSPEEDLGPDQIVVLGEEEQEDDDVQRASVVQVILLSTVWKSNW